VAEGCLGVVLRATPVRESDLMLSLFTDLHGRIAVLARGGRRSQRRFAGALSPLVLARYHLGRRPRGDVWSLESGEVVRDWIQLAQDVVAVAHASYAAELVAALLPPETPEPGALELVLALWDVLAAVGPSPAALRAVELRALGLSGHEPALAACAACGELDLAAGAVFDPARGGALCQRCAATSRGAGVRPLGPGVRGYLVAVAAAASPAAAQPLDRDPRFDAADRIAARDAVVAMVTATAGRPLRALEFIAKLGAAQRRDP
jgi:DNA repair protein RecO (recombination protein O)